MTSAPAEPLGLTKEEFERLNGRMLGVAYRILGSWADAEDVAAEAWIRWQTRRPEHVREAQAWLTTVATRLSLDRLRTMQRRREHYVGSWLPEPIDTALLPHESAEQRQSLDFALLHLMDRLGPEERAVYVLRHAFDYPYTEIAPMLGRTPASCRQIGHRASAKLGPVPQEADLDGNRSLLERLGTAIMAGDVSEAMSLVSPDVVLLSDAGGRTRAALRPIYGPDHVIRFLMGVTTKTPPSRTELIGVNGRPAVRLTSDGVERIFRIDAGDGVVTRAYVLGNPDKLTRLR